MINSISKEIMQEQVKSIVIFNFLDLFNDLEKKIRDCFEKKLESLDNTILNELYFYYGGKIGTYIDYDLGELKLASIKFKRDELFKELTINQIIKFQKSKKIIPEFNYQIKSAQHPSSFFDFDESVIKLISMRNKLAHEMKNLNFKDKDIIEILSNDNIKKKYYKWLGTYNVILMDDATKQIYSNLYYLNEILNNF